MTEIQHTNLEVATRIVDEMWENDEFTLVLNSGDTGALYHIFVEASESSFVSKTLNSLFGRMRNGTGIQIEINASNSDDFYHVLTSYIVKHTYGGSVQKSLGEVV